MTPNFQRENRNWDGGWGQQWPHFIMCPKILKRKAGFDLHRMMDSSTKDSMNIFSPQCQLSA